MELLRCDFCKKVFDNGNVFTVTLQVEDFQEYRDIVRDAAYLSPIIKIDLCPVCIKSVSLSELSDRLLKEQKTLNLNKPQLMPTLDYAKLTPNSDTADGVNWKGNV